MYVECSGPGGGGSRCSFKRIAKIGPRHGEGERAEPPVMEVCVGRGQGECVGAFRCVVSHARTHARTRARTHARTHAQGRTDRQTQTNSQTRARLPIGKCMHWQVHAPAVVLSFCRSVVLSFCLSVFLSFCLSVSLYRSVRNMKACTNACACARIQRDRGLNRRCGHARVSESLVFACM